MIIKSHIRGGYRSAADYLKDVGKNEKTRIVEISDPSAKNLDDAFHNMWVVASNTRCTKPLHHISINPMKDERLTDKQVLAIVQRCEEKYGYKLLHHQRVIVEHIKDGRQHFHVIWNRVSLMTGRPVWPGHHWKKSRQVAREMEIELGLKRLTSRKAKGAYRQVYRTGKSHKIRHFSKSFVPRRPFSLSTKLAQPTLSLRRPVMPLAPARLSLRPLAMPLAPASKTIQKSTRVYPIRRWWRDENQPDSEKLPFRRTEWDSSELLSWAWENGRTDILSQFGICLPPDYFEP